MSIITILSAGIVALDLAVVLGVIALFSRSLRARLVSLLMRNGVPLILALSGLSILGTLYMEYAQLLAPCHLCWWQRIFMYPVALIALVALVKGERVRTIADYVLVLAIPGFAVALYQHLLQVLPSGALIPCDAANDCAVRSVFEFGFVTIPWMALTVFVALAGIALIARFQRQA